MSVSAPAIAITEDRPIPFQVSGSIATGTILQPLNSPMIAIAIVGIAVQFGSSPAVSWLIPALYIATAVTAPMAGRLGALFGARRVYLTGLVLVAVASAIGTFAPNIGWLIAAYILLGIGMAAHFPNAMTMIRAYADRYRCQARAGITIIAICGQSTAALSPTIGGLLVGTFGWKSIMWINLPVVAISALAVSRFADVGSLGSKRISVRGRLRSLDLLGSVLLLGLLTVTMLFLLSLTADPVWWLIPVGAVLVGAFIERERRAGEPLIDVRALMRNRALSATLGRTMLCYTAFYCVFLGIPQWLQYARGMNPVQTGLTMLPLAVISLCSTMIASRTYRRFGARPTLTIGMCAIITGGLLLALVERSTAPVIVLLLVAGVLGIPTGFNNLGNQTLINSATSVDHVGMAIGMYRTVQFIGANLAAVALQMTAGHVIDDAGLHKTGWVIVAIGTVLLVGVLLSRHMPAQKVCGPATS